jgi:ABC-type antimicrobial peptide transport system permease subunit
VVGVVADVRYREIEQPRFDVYLPVAQADAPAHNFVIRTSGDPSAVAASVRSVVRRLVPSSTPTTKTMTSMLAEATSVWRLTLIIIGTFAAFAVLLSATGLYGLLAYVVEERRRDIGIRIALGAAPGQIRRLVIANAGALVAVGLALGVPAFLLVGSAMRSLVFEVSPTDSFAVGGAVLLLASVGMVATYVPAWRASLVDPVETLRAE